VINKLRALLSWYSKGFENGSHLRVRINSAQSIAQVREIVDEAFCSVSPGNS
jgi:tRNA-dihydrouridine synthase